MLRHGAAEQAGQAQSALFHIHQLTDTRDWSVSVWLTGGESVCIFISTQLLSTFGAGEGWLRHRHFLFSPFNLKAHIFTVPHKYVCEKATREGLPWENVREMGLVLYYISVKFELLCHILFIQMQGFLHFRQVF